MVLGTGLSPPKVKYNLHRRIALMLLFLAAVISCMYFIFVLTMVNKLEETMLATLVGHEIDEIVSDMTKDPALRLPKTASVHAYLLSREKQTPIPDYLKALDSTVHQNIEVGDKTFHVAVMEINNDRLFLTFEITEIIRYRVYLLFSLIGGGALAVFFLLLAGIWLSKKFLLPVSDLAYEVASINPNERNIRIEKKYRDYEVGLIANSFDQFMEKMDEFVDREQSVTAAISHELRTPVAVISTSIDLLELAGVTAQQQGAISRIKVSTHYMSKVIESLLFFARKYDKSIDESPQEINLTQLCEDVMKQYSTLAKEKKLSLFLENEVDTRVRISENHIEIILGNLVRNAINNTTDGEVRITVLPNGFSVTDTGCGIHSDNIQRILERSNQRPHSKVSGLGLYLVTNICEFYDLKLEIVSTLGQGSRFTIKFPDILLVE